MSSVGLSEYSEQSGVGVGEVEGLGVGDEFSSSDGLAEARLLESGQDGAQGSGTAAQDGLENGGSDLRGESGRGADSLCGDDDLGGSRGGQAHLCASLVRARLCVNSLGRGEDWEVGLYAGTERVGDGGLDVEGSEGREGRLELVHVGTVGNDDQTVRSVVRVDELTQRERSQVLCLVCGGVRAVRKCLVAERLSVHCIHQYRVSAARSSLGLCQNLRAHCLYLPLFQTRLVDCSQRLAHQWNVASKSAQIVAHKLARRCR